MSAPFTLTIQKRSSSAKGGPAPAKPATSSKFPLQLTFSSASPTLGELKAQIHSKFSKLHPSRQRITTSSETTRKPLNGDDRTTLTELGVTSGDILEVKDLGPQISWQTVFVIEYFGPLAIHPLFYLFSHYIHRSAPFEPSLVQTAAVSLVFLHYLKREFETLFVHRFSNGTMPFTNVFKNSFHYWVLGGVFISYFLYSPAYSRSAIAKISDTSLLAPLKNPNYVYAWVAVWAVAELGNLYTHLQLAWLRPKGSRVRKIPYGGAFALVSCPNYLYEIIGWLAFSALTLSPAALIFALIGAAQMGAWADKKHRAYRKEFKDYPRSRKRLVPFVW
ncbi:3-oxo-5a-steroid 4- dehydrogenase [Tilletia horrida]|nr:3-oxo-5a-steroid 4- dehydrogenase [Tilletia horrida]